MTFDLSKPFPCLVILRSVTAVAQVWATNITYIPLQKGFLCLVTIMDLHSRHVLSCNLSKSLDPEFCLDALEMPLEGGCRPEIFHFDQDCQFTSGDFVARLDADEIKMVGQGEKASTTTYLLNDPGEPSYVRRSACLKRWLRC